LAVLPKLVLRKSPNYSDRAEASRVDLVVVHDTEGGYAGSVEWLCNRGAEASAHVVLKEDGSEATQLVSWDKKAWACVNYNSWSDNIELAGFANRKYPLPQLRAAARIVAFRLKRRGLPPKHVVPSHPGDGRRGYCFHSDLGAAGGNHHDPGFSKAQALAFAAMVKYEYYRGGFRSSWGA